MAREPRPRYLVLAPGLRVGLRSFSEPTPCVSGLGLRVCGSACGAWGSSSRVMVQDLGLRVWGLGFSGAGLAIGFYGLGLEGSVFWVRV